MCMLVCDRCDIAMMRDRGDILTMHKCKNQEMEGRVRSLGCSELDRADRESLDRGKDRE